MSNPKCRVAAITSSVFFSCLFISYISLFFTFYQMSVCMLFCISTSLLNSICSLISTKYFIVFEFPLLGKFPINNLFLSAILFLEFCFNFPCLVYFYTCCLSCRTCFLRTRFSSRKL